MWQIAIIAANKILEDVAFQFVPDRAITAIDFDHEAYLGHTLPEIAGEKAGVIKPKPETPIIDRSYPVMFKVLQKARDKAGLDKRIQINHGFRKYFENSLLGVDPDQKDLLEGHFATISSKHYTGREWDDLRPVYAKAYPQIDLNTGDPELVQKLESWHEEKRRLVERFEQERGEWRKELNDLRELVKKEIQDRKKE